jgi:signal transduction histidine kinase
VNTERNTGSTPELSGDQIAFFGKITASVTHELNNVISIIEQTAGLLDDMVAGEERGVPISLDRLAGVSASIQKQTQRGLGIIGRLNRFAHTTDHPYAVFDGNEVVSNLVELSRRLAGLKKMELEFRPAESVPRISGNPFDFQRAVFSAIQTALACGRADQTVTIENRVGPDSFEVRVVSAISSEPGPDPLAALEAVVTEAGGKMTIGSGDNKIRLGLRFAGMPAAEDKSG